MAIVIPEDFMEEPDPQSKPVYSRHIHQQI